MKEEGGFIACGEFGSATGCGSYPATDCSKSESATPMTDALFAKCKARPTDGSGSRDGGWGQQDIADFLRHSRKLEIALAIATDALEFIASRTSELQAGSMHESANRAIGELQALNTGHHDGAASAPSVDGFVEDRNSEEK